MTKTYVALLRGINVGGSNVIKMSDLAACFVTLGLQNVRTYIQSGNVLFSAGDRDETQLAKSIETALSQMFHYQASLVLRSLEEMTTIVTRAPDGFGSDPETFRYDVIFLKEPLTVQEAMGQLLYKEGVDRAYVGEKVLYFVRLISKATQSRLTRVNTLPMYQNMTIRNWNTSTKIFNLMKAIEAE